MATALSVAGGDLKVQEKYEAAEVEQMRQQVGVAEMRAAAEGTDEARQLVKDMRQQVLRRELEIATGRANRKPQDLRLQFELAVALKRAGNLPEAEKMFGQLRANAQLKAAATLELGECLQQQKKYSHALQFYSRAVELTEKNDVNLRKLALYRAGTLAVGLRQLDPARRWLRELVNLDPNYRDAKARLDKIRGVSNKE
ncbi:MAG: tetratricopeptide repeat protein [Planctomycetales bacterium]|nr:tetratricopeptide repeat protein [Planctomycetales bacterium]